MSNILKVLELDNTTGMFIISWLNLKDRCRYCGKKITEENLGGIYNKPLRVVCNDMNCIMSCGMKKE